MIVCKAIILLSFFANEFRENKKIGVRDSLPVIHGY
jgi:hypothetical protein